MRIRKVVALVLGAALCFSSSPAFAVQHLSSDETFNSSEADDHSRYIKLIAGSSEWSLWNTLLKHRLATIEQVQGIIGSSYLGGERGWDYWCNGGQERQRKKYQKEYIDENGEKQIVEADIWIGPPSGSEKECTLGKSLTSSERYQTFKGFIGSSGPQTQ